MTRILVVVLTVALALASFGAEDAPAGGDPKPALQALQKEVELAKTHAAAALKAKALADLEAAYAEIDALVPKFETWEESAHKAGWGDEQIEKEQKTAGWDDLLSMAKNLKEEIAQRK